jgi:hypothetical protein
MQYFEQINSHPLFVDKGFTLTESGCMEYRGKRCIARGYKVKVVNGSRYLVHRLTWEQVNGPIPNNLCVLHKCDNPKCANPDHLFLGTRADNHKDMIRKGRNSGFSITKGEAHPKSKLSESDVLNIRAKHATGYSVSQIAKQLNVSWNCINDVLSSRTWNHV